MMNSSLALVSARATINSLEILSLLSATYLFVLCQALDLRAMQYDFQSRTLDIARDLLTQHFSPHLNTAQLDKLYSSVSKAIVKALDAGSSADAVGRLRQVAAATSTPIVDFCTAEPALTPALASIVAFRADLAAQGANALQALRAEYVEGKKGPAPAAKYLGRTKPMYEFVRVTLGVRMHGAENLHEFEAGPGVEEVSIGQNISVIHEAIRDGKVQPVVLQMFRRA